MTATTPEPATAAKLGPMWPDPGTPGLYEIHCSCLKWTRTGTAAEIRKLSGSHDDSPRTSHIVSIMHGGRRIDEPETPPAAEVRTCYCGMTAPVVPGVFPHPDCDGSAPAGIPDSFDSPDGRTYSEPVTAATPEQAAPVEPWRAAWLAFREAAGFDYADDRAPDDELDAQWIASWQAAAQAAIDAATEGSLRVCGYTLADVGRFLEAEAATQEPRAADGDAICECGHYWAHHAFSDDVCAVVGCPCSRPRPEPQPGPVSASQVRRHEAQAAQEPQPAPGVTEANAGFTAWAEASRIDPLGMDYAEYGADVLRDAFAAGMSAAQPAPELAAAMAETRKVREILSRVFGSFSTPDQRNVRHASITRLTIDRWKHDAGLEDK